MRRSFLAIAAGVAVLQVLAAAPPALAAPDKPVRSDRPFRRFLHAEANWVFTYKDLAEDYARFISELEVATDTAVELYEKGDRAAGEVWARKWAADARARLAQLKAARAALSPNPPGLTGVGYDLNHDADAVRLMEGASHLPTALESRFDDVDQGVEALIDLVARVARGDDDPMDELTPVNFAAHVAGMRLGVSVLEGLMPLVIADGTPQDDVMGAEMAWARAGIVTIDFVRLALSGKGPNDRDAADQVRVEAAGIQAASDRVGVRVDAAQSSVGAAGPTPWNPTCFRLDQQDLGKLAAAARALATEIEKPGGPDLEAIWRLTEAGVVIAGRIDERYCPAQAPAAP